MTVSRIHSGGWIASLCMLVSSIVFAQNLDQAEKHYQRLVHRHQRLERRLREQARYVHQLKRQPAGVRRNLRLQTALRSSEELATRLKKSQHMLRRARDTLLQQFDLKIAQTHSEETKRKLLKRRQALFNPSTQKGRRVFISGKIDPLADPEELEERADLIKDSEEKVRRQIANIRRQIVAAARAKRLYRHDRATNASMFFEGSPVRVGGTKIVTRSPNTSFTPGAGGQQAAGPRDTPTSPQGVSGDGPQPPMNASQQPTPANAESTETPNSTVTGSDERAPNSIDGSGSQGESVSIGLRSVLDPGSFQQLQSAQKTGNTQLRLQVLKKAKVKLERLANRLSHTHRQLKKKAAKRRKKPMKKSVKKNKPKGARPPP